MGIFNRRKQINVYALIHKEFKDKFLTIAKDKDSVYEYAMMFLKLTYQDHYERWCQIKQLDKDDYETWMMYYNECIDEKEKENLQILKVKYDLDNILAILRMFGKCVPLGCSFETQAERDYFRSILVDEALLEEFLDNQTHNKN